MKIHHLVEAESLWALSQRGTVNLPQVKTLQDKLKAAGHDPGASDGWYGKKTADAVRAYQQANGLKIDGDAGPNTLAKLGLGGTNNTPPVETPPEETPSAPAPRQPASEPAPAPAPRTPANQPSNNPAATNQREPEQTTSIQTSGSIIRLSSNPSSSEMRGAIRNLNLPVRFERFADYGDYFSLELQSTQLSRADGRPAGVRLNNQIVDAMESRLKADWGDKKIDFLLRGTDGNSLDYPKDVFLEPAPRQPASEPAPTPASSNSIDWQSKAASLRDGIADNFRDPQSLRFRNTQIRQITGKPSNPKIIRPNSYILVGSVNGKNAYGAYAGAKRFTLSLMTGPMTNGETYVLPGLFDHDSGKSYERTVFDDLWNDIKNNSKKVTDLNL